MGPTPVVTTHKSAPRHPRIFAGVAGRAARALTTAACALALAVGALALAPAPAQAYDPPTTQGYFSYYHFDAARQRGYTGKGVTIALIDGPVDTNAPELAGANITDKSQCKVGSTPDDVQHAVDMAAILVSPHFGVAPDATLYTYQTSNASTESSGTCSSGGERLDTIGKLINRAIDDGAQIISISQSIDPSDELKWAVTNATAHGVIIVASAGNKSIDDNSNHVGQYSGVVGVSAINIDGTFASYSSWGNGVVTAAVGGPFDSVDPNTNEPARTNGTSNSAALVAGMLALARQKWPDATPNQILQLLVHTALNPNHDWNQQTGYGPIDGGALVNTDPSQYPDENPIIDKPGGSSPTAKEIQDFTDGTITPNLARNVLPSSYVYRGTNDEIAIVPTEGLTIHLGTSPAYHRK